MRRRTYAVWWDDGEGPRHAGKLELGPLHVLLSGNGAGRVALPLDDIASVDYSRGELSLRSRSDRTIQIGSLDAPGALLEVSEAVRRGA